MKKQISKCDVCASRKPPHRKPKVYSVGVPMERLEIDIAGPLTKTNKGHEYNLVISDYFTKSTQAFAIKDQEATTIASILVNEIVSLFGVPKCYTVIKVQTLNRKYSGKCARFYKLIKHALPPDVLSQTVW